MFSLLLLIVKLFYAQNQSCRVQQRAVNHQRGHQLLLGYQQLVSAREVGSSALPFLLQKLVLEWLSCCILHVIVLTGLPNGFSLHRHHIQLRPSGFYHKKLQSNVNIGIRVQQTKDAVNDPLSSLNLRNFFGFFDDALERHLNQKPVRCLEESASDLFGFFSAILAFSLLSVVIGSRFNKEKIKKMFVRGLLFVVLCCATSAEDVRNDRWVFWDTNGHRVPTNANEYHGIRVPLDGNANVADFTAIEMERLDEKLDVSQLEMKFSNVTRLRLYSCDLAVVNAVFAGRTLRHIKRIEILSDQKRGRVCPRVLDETPEVSAFKSFPLLERLELKGLRFKAVTKRFAPSRTLRALRIEDASIEHIAVDFFRNYPALEEIGLQFNQLTNLDVGTFAGNPNLKDLYLRDNRLSELPEQLLQQNGKLRKLELFNNQIRNLPERLLAPATDLEEFEAFQNQLNSIPAQFFANNRRLRLLHFSGNQIKSLSPTLFVGLTELRECEFHSNRIRSLGAGLFKDSSKLTKVWFFDNQLTKISPDLFHRAAPLADAAFMRNPCTQGSTEQSDIANCIENFNKAMERQGRGEFLGL